MKNILIIAYFYPPKGGAGVQRTTKFANYLSKMGYNVSVLTVKEESKGLIDKSLNKDIDENISVYRTDIKEPNIINRLSGLQKKKNTSNKEQIKEEGNSKTYQLCLKTMKNKVRTSVLNLSKKTFFKTYNLYYIPDDKKGWIDFAVKKGKEIIRNKNIDVIFTTSGPYSSHLIGYKLSKISNIKWIADFRDPWVENPFINNGALVEMIYSRLERKVIKRADKVISVSKPIIDSFIRRYKDENINKFHVITNGYDENDFKELDLSQGKNNNRFTILYNGTLYGKRSPENILQSIDNLIRSNNIDKNKIKIKFQGQIGNEHIGIVQYYMSKYPEVIEHENYVPHGESLKELSKANALLLIIDEGKGSEGIFTGKIFEYIRTGKPILGIVPEGVAKDLILDTNTGYVASSSNQKDIEKIILSSYLDFVSRRSSINPNWNKIKEYSRENLTKQLIRVMYEIKN